VRGEDGVGAMLGEQATEAIVAVVLTEPAYFHDGLLPCGSGERMLDSRNLSPV